jgi:hypothetical protein
MGGNSRRVRMAEAIRRECDPFADSLGFRHPREGDWNRWLTSRRNVYLRSREGGYDEVLMCWGRRGAPWFRMEFECSRPDSLPSPDGGISREVRGGLAYAWTGRIAPLCRDKFGPWRSIADTVELTNQCFSELDAWFKNDVAGRHLVVLPVRRITPTDGWSHSIYRTRGDPTLDPERD